MFLTIANSFSEYRWKFRKIGEINNFDKKQKTTTFGAKALSNKDGG